jgi:hypothetical protein
VGLGINQLDQSAKALEVPCVERQQPALAMRDHRGGDVGIVDLAAGTA